MDGKSRIVRLFLDGFVGSDLAVTNEDNAVSMVCNVVFMGDENDGVSLTVEILEEGHDFFAGFRIQVARGLVRQDD